MPDTITSDLIAHLLIIHCSYFTSLLAIHTPQSRQTALPSPESSLQLPTTGTYQLLRHVPRGWKISHGLRLRLLTRSFTMDKLILMLYQAGALASRNGWPCLLGFSSKTYFCLSCGNWGQNNSILT